MSNETCTVTIADIYGAEWLSANKEELDRKWEWSFGVELNPCQFANAASDSITQVYGRMPLGPRIILHRRKPKPPTLREVYGVDEVTIPQGWEWAGEFKTPAHYDWWLGDEGRVVINVKASVPRLILRKRPKKVWFKAEDVPRPPLIGDCFWRGEKWQTASEDFRYSYLCATRHEEIDTTVQVVTQEDIDRCGR
jgi:hypothetical protein